MEKAKYKSVDDVLRDMPLYAQAVEGVKQRGQPTEWMSKTTDISDPYCFFEKNGKYGVKSDCPYYKGRYNAGSSAATSCKALDFLLPGTITDIYCRTHYKECPIRAESTPQTKEGDNNNGSEENF